MVGPDEGSRFHAHALEGGAVTTDGIEDWASEQIRQIPLDGCAVRQGEPDAESIEPKATQAYYVPIYPCVSDFANVQPIPLPLTNVAGLIQLILSAQGQGCNGKNYDFAGSSGIVEYYNASLDHYFITWVADEIAALDAGASVAGWKRTGSSIRTSTAAQDDTSPVCRYYIPPALGNSHFFGREAGECNAAGRDNPGFVLEDPAFMHMYLPTAGRCLANSTPVYRVFSNRPDANHRYTTDRAVREAMVAKGWLAEGDGPDLVVMCAPQ
jgi:hypothetical protein